MKIAVIRGPSLNLFEMQYYEPLAKQHRVVCFTSTSPVYDLEGLSLPIVRLPCWGQWAEKIPGGIAALLWWQGDPQGLWNLEKRLSGFDIAHSAELFSYYTHQALEAKRQGKVKRVVATVSENIPFNQEWYPRQKALKKFALKNLDHILAISSLSKQAMLIEGYPEEKVTVVPHGLDLNRFQPGKKNWPLAKEIGLQANDLVVLTVGRQVKEKGGTDLLLALAALARRKMAKNLKLVLVGGGPEREHLVNLGRRLGISRRLIFQESLPYKKMPEWYRLADIFVLPSKPTPVWQEQFGMVLLEAMACGVPVVATKSGAIAETVGEAGILVSPNSWPELAGALKKLILDEKLRQSLSKKGRRRVENQFERRKIAQKIEKIYQKVLAIDG